MSGNGENAQEGGTGEVNNSNPPAAKRGRHEQACLFVGTRVIKPRYLFIDDYSIQRQFTTPDNSEIPHYGLALHKYNEILSQKMESGRDEDGNYTGERGTKRTYDELVEETVTECKSFSDDEKNYLWAVVKNLMAARMSWRGTKLHQYALQEALGINRDFPGYDALLWDLRKNRDNCQSGILNGAHECVLEFIATPIGKDYIEENKAKPWKVYNRKTRRNELVLIHPKKLDEAGFNDIATAKKVYHEVIEAIDMSKLVLPDGSTTYLGKCLIAKAKALIQLELCYVRGFWIDAETGEYTRAKKQHHCRDKGTILAYLKTIDQDTMQKAKLKIKGAGGVAVETDVQRLFPMPEGKTYMSTRSSKVDEGYVTASSDDTRVILGTNPCDIEESDEDD